MTDFQSLPPVPIAEILKTSWGKLSRVVMHVELRAVGIPRLARNNWGPWPSLFSVGTFSFCL
jgi:hypothetical protein